MRAMKFNQHGGIIMARKRKFISTVFGNKLAQLRTSRNMTQIELGVELNVSGTAISRYENGLDEPSFDTVLKIAKLFGKDPNYLLGWTEEELNTPEKRFLKIMNDHATQIYKDFIAQ